LNDTVQSSNGVQTQSTHVVYEDQNPIWNEQLIIRGDGEPSGYIFITFYDDLENKLDQISVPVNFIHPHMTTSLALKICNGEALVYLAFNLQTRVLPEDSLDNLVTFGVKWVDFDPLPADDNYFSLCIAKTGQPLGSRLEHSVADTRDETSLSRAFYLAKDPERRQVVFLSPVWPFRFKPATMLV
jgi:hypothetical protein